MQSKEENMTQVRATFVVNKSNNDIRQAIVNFRRGKYKNDLAINRVGKCSGHQRWICSNFLTIGNNY